MVRPVPTQDNKYKICGSTFMPQAGVKTAIPMLEWSKVVSTSVRAATVIDSRVT
jgi:hypothetical protein